MFKNSISELNQVFFIVVINTNIPKILDISLLAVKKKSPKLQCRRNAQLKNDRECSDHCCCCPAKGFRSSAITRN